jgi:hypothetical protein
VNILFLDFLYSKGHIGLNKTLIEYLSEIGKVYVLTPKGVFNNLPASVVLIEENSFAVRKGKILKRLSSLKVMILTALKSREIVHSHIFVSTYDTMMFAIGRHFFRKKDKIFLLHHFNIDELENNVKSWFFKRYMRNVDHIVFEEFIKEYLIKRFNLDENKIHVLPHPLNQDSIQINTETEYICVGLSNSNDEKIIADIVKMEEKLELLKKDGRKVILKSKDIKFDNGFLIVVNGFLEENVYKNYIKKSKCIYAPFPSTFRYRMSGTLVDAFSNNKIVLGSDIPLFKQYENDYPDICKTVKNADEFYKHVLNISKEIKPNQQKEFLCFQSKHSKENIMEVFKKF